jgi:hypothetical protein
MSIAESLIQLRLRVTHAAPSNSSITIVGVTKSVPYRHVCEAIDAGLTHVGENYAQEAVVKFAQLRDEFPSVERHFVGALQTNKIRQLVGLVDVWQSVDRESVILELAKHDPGARVFIQVNVGAESQKGGCEPDRCAQVVERARELGLNVVGLMTLGVAADAVATQEGFDNLAVLARDLSLDALSMGMSDDLELALASGATHLRVGTALFGSRAVRDDARPTSGT